MVRRIFFVKKLKKSEKMGKFKKVSAKVTSSSLKTSNSLKFATKFKSTTKEMKPKGIQRLEKSVSVPTPSIPKEIGVNEFADFSIKKSSIKEKKKTGKVKRLTKKERQNLRKEQILERIQATQAAFLEDKAKAKREKTEIIKDVKPLLDALPSLDSIFQFKNDKLRTGVPAYDKPQKKSQVKQERREQKSREFQEKLNLHKTLVQNLSALPVDKRREAIREAIKRRKEAQMVNEEANEEMQEE